MLMQLNKRPVQIFGQGCGFLDVSTLKRWRAAANIRSIQLSLRAICRMLKHAEIVKGAMKCYP